MLTGWRYRVTSVAGAAVITVLAFRLANHPIPQHLFTTYVPLFNRLEPTVLSGETFTLAVLMSVVVVVACLIPLYKPRPRRQLDVIMLAQKRVVVASLALATVGFFKWSHRLPRPTHILLSGVLVLSIPAWFVLIRRRPLSSKRTILVGDDLHQLARVYEEMDTAVLGYLCPTRYVPRPRQEDEAAEAVALADGGPVLHGLGGLSHLGGLSRLEDVLVERDVDTAVLAFSTADRAEFFGALDACYEHGVGAKVHREYADSVLLSPRSPGPIVDVELEPWDPQDYLFKRAFDVVFAFAGLVALAPLMVLIAIAVKLDSRGPVLYRQDRTAVFGERFTVYKFRSMVHDAESKTGAKISEEDAGAVDPRVTRVGRVLRRTHLDEIPQLWAILLGNMSVVGPRPERPELDANIRSDVFDWQKRWFVKPGLTGLAQINGVTGHDPDQKLFYDLEYVKNQSLGYDLKIVVRQFWKVWCDVRTAIVGRGRSEAVRTGSDSADTVRPEPDRRETE